MRTVVITSPTSIGARRTVRMPLADIHGVVHPAQPGPTVAHRRHVADRVHREAGIERRELGHAVQPASPRSSRASRLSCTAALKSAGSSAMRVERQEPLHQRPRGRRGPTQRVEEERLPAVGLVQAPKRAPARRSRRASACRRSGAPPRAPAGSTATPESVGAGGAAGPCVAAAGAVAIRRRTARPGNTASARIGIALLEQPVERAIVTVDVAVEEYLAVLPCNGGAVDDQHRDRLRQRHVLRRVAPPSPPRSVPASTPAGPAARTGRAPPGRRAGRIRASSPAARSRTGSWPACRAGRSPARWAA